MHIICFRIRGGPSDIRMGARVSDEDILDFTAPATGIPWPGDGPGAYDLDIGHLKIAEQLAARCTDDPDLRDTLRGQGAIHHHTTVELLPPVLRPGKIICIGLNYRDHAEESGMAIPDSPVCFSKFPSCAIAHEEEVRIPLGSTQTDFEAELAVVIGRHASRVRQSDAMDHVLGFAACNDVSARDFQFADGQWQRGKSCDTFFPFGPSITTRTQLPDPSNLRIGLRLNGEVMQDSNTSQLIFDVKTIVSFLSQVISLEPGDVIATGTPPGVGFARTPPVYLKPGDVTEVFIEGLETLTNPVVGPDGNPYA